MRFGRFAARNGQAEKAETAFSLAVQYRPTLPAYTLQYGTWLLSTDRIDQGLVLLKTTLELDDEYSDTVIRTLLVANVDHERILTAIPRAPGPMFAYADFLYTVGRQSQGQEIYREMLAIWESWIIPKYRTIGGSIDFLSGRKILKMRWRPWKKLKPLYPVILNLRLSWAICTGVRVFCSRPGKSMSRHSMLIQIIKKRVSAWRKWILNQQKGKIHNRAGSLIVYVLFHVLGHDLMYPLGGRDFKITFNHHMSDFVTGNPQPSVV
jgi:hypothetical protein